MQCVSQVTSILRTISSVRAQERNRMAPLRQHSPALREFSLAHGAIAARRPAVAIPIGVLLAGLERPVADALHVIQTIQASVTAGPDALLGGRLALAALAARGMAFRSIPRIIAVGVHVGVGWGFRVHLTKNLDVRRSKRTAVGRPLVAKTSVKIGRGRSSPGKGRSKSILANSLKSNGRQ